ELPIHEELEVAALKADEQINWLVALQPPDRVAGPEALQTICFSQVFLERVDQLPSRRFIAHGRLPEDAPAVKSLAGPVRIVVQLICIRVRKWFQRVQLERVCLLQSPDFT